MLSWRSIVVKIFLWALNILFVFTSLITFTIGVRLLHDINERRNIDSSIPTTYPPPTNNSTFSPNPSAKNEASNVAISMIAIGILVLGAALFAIVSVIKDRSSLLTIYIYFLSACTVVVIVLVFVLAFLVPDVLRNIRSSMQAKMESFKDQYDSRFLWHYLQYYFFCCGVDGYADWKTFLGNGNYPLGCCQKSDNFTLNEITNETKTCNESELIYTDGCFNDANMIRYKTWIFSILILVLLGIIIILTLSCILGLDRKLEIARTVCMQYAAHLNVCRSKVSNQQFQGLKSKSKYGGNTSGADGKTAVAVRNGVGTSTSTVQVISE